jgi:hypothetical protein
MRVKTNGSLEFKEGHTPLFLISVNRVASECTE